MVAGSIPAEIQCVQSLAEALGSILAVGLQVEVLGSILAEGLLVEVLGSSRTDLLWEYNHEKSYAFHSVGRFWKTWTDLRFCEVKRVACVVGSYLSGN